MDVSCSLYIDVMSASHAKKAAQQRELTSLILNSECQFLNIVPKMLHGFPARMKVVVNLAPLADTPVAFQHQSGLK